MEQLKLVDHIVNLDKYIDHRGIEYIGNATLYMDGTGRCLANIGGMLCIVEIKWK